MKVVENKYRIKPVHDILYVDLLGSWNPDRTYDYSLEYKKIVSRYFAREWVCVLNLQHLDLLISEPAQVETFKALNTWSYIKGMTALVVMVGIQNRHHLLYQFEEIFNDRQPYEKVVFYSDVELNAWMSDHGLFKNILHDAQKTA